MVVRFYLSAVIWAIFMAMLILMPGDRMPETGGLLAFDKVAHTSVFTILALLVAVSFSKHKQLSGLRFNTILFVLSSCIMYGIVLEFIQSQVPEREFDVFDMVANSSGAMLGMIVFYIIYKL